MSFFRHCFLCVFSYSINGTVLVSVDSGVNDLGFILIPLLCPRAHIDYITYKANKVLGFIKRTARKFKLSRSLKELYCALVRPIIENGSVVWKPHLMVYCQQIERVQRKFLSFAVLNLNIIHLVTMLRYFKA